MITGLIGNSLFLNGKEFNKDNITLSTSGKIIFRGYSVTQLFSPISLDSKYDYICFKDGKVNNNYISDNYFYTEELGQYLIVGVSK